MNKYEKLIEHIINDDEASAKELFHQLVVEKSRDIYESLMDEDLGGNQAQGFVQDITNQNDAAQDMALEADDEGDLELDDDGLGDDGDDFDGEEETFGEPGMGDDAEHADIMDKMEELESQLADLKSMLGTEEHEIDDMEQEVQDAEQDVDHEEGTDDMSDFDHDDMEESQEDFNEAKMMSKPKDIKSAKFSDDPISGKKQSGEEYKSKNRDTGLKMGPKHMESRNYKKTEVDIMKEYVDKIGEIYKIDNPNSESGKTIGTGGNEPSVNKRSIGLDKAPDFGGSNENMQNGIGNEQSPDGKPFKAPTNEYTKKRGELPNAGQFKNVPGSKKVWDGKPDRTYAKIAQKGTNGDPEKGTLVGADGTRPINNKPIVGGPGEPTGKKK